MNLNGPISSNHGQQQHEHHEHHPNGGGTTTRNISVMESSSITCTTPPPETTLIHPKASFTTLPANNHHHQQPPSSSSLLSLKGLSLTSSSSSSPSSSFFCGGGTTSSSSPMSLFKACSTASTSTSTSSSPTSTAASIFSTKQQQQRTTKSPTTTTSSMNTPTVMKLTNPAGNVDPLIAHELGSLTVEQREQLYEEIHGISNPLSETHPLDTSTTTTKESEDFIQCKLQQLEFEIKNIRNRYEYNLVHFLAPSTVKDSNFCLQFLRAEQFQIKKAAQRLIIHFKHKVTLFGLSKVAKKITLDDLTSDDKLVLYSGSLQVLPIPDVAGRTIFFFSPKHDRYKTWQNQLRVLWYLLMSALETNENDIQRRGMVGIFYFTGYTMEDRKSNASDIPRHSYLIREGIPFRVSSLHWCLNDPRVHTILSLFRTLSGKEYRLRFRDHFGSHIECQYSLMSFGIPRNILPVDAMGNLHCRGLMQFLETLHIKEEIDKQKTIANSEFLQQQEETQQEKETDGKKMKKSSTKTKATTTKKNNNNNEGPATTTMDEDETTSTTTHINDNKKKPTMLVDLDDQGRIMVDVAHQNDVLFGRGKPYQVHPGNIRLAALIEERQAEYNISDRNAKTQISWDIVHLILQQEGGRFLKKDEQSDSWEQVRYAVAREKVAHGFRTPYRGGSSSSGAATAEKAKKTTTKTTGGRTKKTTTTTTSSTKKKKTTTSTNSTATTVNKSRKGRGGIGGDGTPHPHTTSSAEATIIQSHEDENNSNLNDDGGRKRTKVSPVPSQNDMIN